MIDVRHCATLIIGALLLLNACVVEQSQLGPSRLVLDDGTNSANAARHAAVDAQPLPRRTSQGNWISIDRLGVLPCNQFTLPIAQPGLALPSAAEVIAVQTGHHQSWDTLLGRSGIRESAAALPVGVRIYSCVPDQAPIVRVEHPGVLLGRNANSEGVLVERPNRNGSRWIGIAPWDGASIRWLRFDDKVNAFGWIAEDGSLAYSTRSVHASRSTIAIIRPGGALWTLHEPLPWSWLLPILTPNGEQLYAFRLGDGIVDLAYASSMSNEAFRQSLRTHRVSNRVNEELVWRMLVATTGGAGLSGDALVYFSHQDQQLALWFPDKNDVQLLAPDSIAALSIGQNTWLLTTPNRLLQTIRLEDSMLSTTLFNVGYVARQGRAGATLLVRELNGNFVVDSMRINEKNDPPATTPAPRLAPETARPQRPRGTAR